MTTQSDAFAAQRQAIGWGGLRGVVAYGGDRRRLDCPSLYAARVGANLRFVRISAARSAGIWRVLLVSCRLRSA